MEIDTINDIGKLLLVEGKRIALYLFYMPTSWTSGFKTQIPERGFLLHEDQVLKMGFERNIKEKNRRKM